MLETYLGGRGQGRGAGEGGFRLGGRGAERGQVEGLIVHTSSLEELPFLAYMPSSGSPQTGRGF
jgi:hypothetical protein